MLRQIMGKIRLPLLLIVILNILLYLLLLYLVKLDTDFTYRWPLLFFYFTTFLFLPVVFLYSYRSLLANNLYKLKAHVRSPEGKIDLLWFTLILFLVIATRFLYLKEHPFLTWGDELWETGLESIAIFKGEIKNLYLVGYPDPYRTPSMGLITPLIPALFAPFLAHTAYMYRIPAAIFGALDILLVYFICWRHINRSVALFSALSLIALPIHIYFSRSELVFTFDIFMTTLIIYLLFLTRQYFLDNRYWLSVMGLVFGFTLTCHPSIRIIALVALGITLILYTARVITDRYQKSKFLTWVKYIVLVSVFTLIGYGPKILFISQTKFLHSQGSVIFQDVDTTRLLRFDSVAVQKLRKNITSVITERYRLSFLGYFKEPLTNLVQFHYTEEKPLLPPLLGFLFLVGLVGALGTRYPLPKWYALFALLIPFTHSALTPDINWSYRTFVASSSAAVLIGIGSWQIVSRIYVKTFKYILIAAFCLYLFLIVISFFILEPQMFNRPVEEYMTTHLSYFLAGQLDKQRFHHLCLRVSPEQLLFLDWIHAHNQYRYFVPQAKIDLSADPNVLPNTIYIDENCRPKAEYKLYRITCSQNLYSICPRPTLYRVQNEPEEINRDFLFYY